MADPHKRGWYRWVPLVLAILVVIGGALILQWKEHNDQRLWRERIMKETMEKLIKSTPGSFDGQSPE